MSSSLKTNFSVESKHSAFYTGGNVQVTRDGVFMLCGCGNKVQVLDVTSGNVINTIGEAEDEEITNFALSPDDQVLVLATQNLVLRQWDWREKVLTRSWKAIHAAPVSCMSFDPTTTLLATGGSDSTVKIWDIVRQYCTHNLRGHTGVIRVVQFHPDMERLEVYTAADDNKIRVWDLRTSGCSHILDTHYSVITSLVFSSDGYTLVSSGRDSIIAVWNIQRYELQKTIPVFEVVESMFLLPESEELSQINKTDQGLYCVTAGNKGMLRVWDIQGAKCVHSQGQPIAISTKEEADHGQIITRTVFTEATSTVTVVTYDHNILLFAVEDFSLKKQFAGYMEEVLDVQFLGVKDTHLALVSNSEQVKVFDLATWTCQILHGHTDIVLSLAVNKTADMIVSSSKDNTIRLWRLEPDSGRVNCVAVGYGHTHAVGTVTFSRYSPSYVVSGSQDCTLKVWSLPEALDNGKIANLHARLTEKAHDKDVNSVVVAPNGKLIASGSQDRTAKLWDSELTFLGVMRGHKRGVWCVQFSPVDQCLATTSGDGTIKIWVLTDFTCVKTFEGHDSSVLKVIFLSRGMQLLSSGSDGLMKLWTIKTNECVKTFDEHEDKIWALALSKSEDVAVTGGADSTVIIWKDVTKTELEDLRKTQEEFILQEQELSNLIQQKKYLKAIGLAITLEQPFRVLNIFKKILESPDKKTELQTMLTRLRTDQVDSLLRFAAQWNTNGRHCHVTQMLLSVLLHNNAPEGLTKHPNIQSTIEALLPYTERHYQRLVRLSQQAQFVEYTWQKMRAVASTSDGPVKGMGSESDTVYILNVKAGAQKNDKKSSLSEGRAVVSPIDLAMAIRETVSWQKPPVSLMEDLSHAKKASETHAHPAVTMTTDGDGARGDEAVTMKTDPGEKGSTDGEDKCADVEQTNVHKPARVLQKISAGTKRHKPMETSVFPKRTKSKKLKNLRHLSLAGKETFSEGKSQKKKKNG